jgi:hypothetical protein
LCEQRGTSRNYDKQNCQQTTTSQDRWLHKASAPLRRFGLKSHTTVTLSDTKKAGFTGTEREIESEIIRGGSVADVLKFSSKESLFMMLA